MQELNPQLKNMICVSKKYDIGIVLKPMGGSLGGHDGYSPSLSPSQNTNKALPSSEEGNVGCRGCWKRYTLLTESDMRVGLNNLDQSA